MGSSLGLAHDDGGGHEGVDLAVNGVGAGFRRCGEGDRVLSEVTVVKDPSSKVTVCGSASPSTAVIVAPGATVNGENR